ncbi:MAG: hypothetical protein LAN84_01785 [Acidobacteriia bacterium]|nr:hypothetical protein [Terriglobia bacterium]
MTQKKQIILLLALVAIAAAVWYAGTRPPAKQAATGAWNLNFPPLAVDNPQLHWWKAEAARKTDYARSRRNIFSAIAPPPPAEEKKIEMAKQPALPVIPPRPTVAPLPVKFFGYATLPASGTKRAFFTDGDDVFIVGEGEALFGRFRVVRIGNNSLEYEEIASGLRGTLALEEAPQA